MAADTGETEGRRGGRSDGYAEIERWEGGGYAGANCEQLSSCAAHARMPPLPHAQAHAQRTRTRSGAPSAAQRRDGAPCRAARVGRSSPMYASTSGARRALRGKMMIGI